MRVARITELDDDGERTTEGAPTNDGNAPIVAGLRAPVKANFTQLSIRVGVGCDSRGHKRKPGGSVSGCGFPAGGLSLPQMPSLRGPLFYLRGKRSRTASG